MEEKRPVVYFTDLKSDIKRNLFDKIDALLAAVGLEGRFRKGHLVAVKLHFGEKGNTSYIRPVFVRRVVDRIKETGARPFLTDTNTLYVGTRSNSPQHICTAIENGFGYAVTAAPIIIADGIRGMDFTPVEVKGRHFEEVSIAREIADANALAVLTHFKCHEMAGFGGALKNLGMGCASREGKLAQHSNCPPVVDPQGCVACGECAPVCPVDAITIGAVAVIDEETCIGCGHCISACPEDTIKIKWNESASILQEKMVEHARGALVGKEQRCVFINFLTQISPECDCYGHTDAPIVPDIGIMASIDPVAIDQASADLVNAAAGYRGNASLKSGFEPGGDKFRGVHEDVDWEVQLLYGEEMGLGKRDYNLERI
ncbi:MAG: DUF362 domain-containing protein [Thermodesulfobacteriota bacterium]|nr:MAG: DUF362 domain-containing protein [Thermodesulfobacteriota bacterium]